MIADGWTAHGTVDARDAPADANSRTGSRALLQARALGVAGVVVVVGRRVGLAFGFGFGFGFGPTSRISGEAR